MIDDLEYSGETMDTDDLKKLPLFAGLSPEESDCLELGEEILVPAGEFISREGDPDTSFYVVLDGEIRLSKIYGGQDVVMAVHKAGKFFGEVPLLLDIPYFVDIQARTASRLLREHLKAGGGGALLDTAFRRWYPLFRPESGVSRVREAPSVAS